MGFRFTILTPEGKVFDQEIDRVLLPTVDGPLMIEPGYTNIIVSLVKAGILKVIVADKPRYFAVFGGAVEVSKDHGCILMSEEINDGYDIDMARAIAARDRNLDLLKEVVKPEEMQMVKAKLAKALVRISTKELSQGKQDF